LCCMKEVGLRKVDARDKVRGKKVADAEKREERNTGTRGGYFHEEKRVRPKEIALWTCQKKPETPVLLGGRKQLFEAGNGPILQKK